MRQPSHLPRPGLIAAAVLAGCLLAATAGPPLAGPLIWLAALGLAVAVGRRRGTWLAAGFAAGGAWTALWAPPPSPVVLAPVTTTIDGQVVPPVEHRPDGARFTLATSLGGVDVTVRGTSSRFLPGDRLAVSGRLRGARGYRNPGSAGRRQRALASRGAVASMAVAADQIVRGGQVWSPRRQPVAARLALADGIAARGGDPEGNALARAMALGQRGALPPAVTDRFRDAGIAHLLAVSGLHVGAVALLCFWLVRRSSAALSARVDAVRAGALIAGLAAIAYTLLTGARTSSVRALIVVLLVLTGLACCRRARLIDLLGIAALLLVIADPHIVVEPSFQLSFAATAALALAMGGRASPAGEHGGVGRRLARRVGQLAEAALWASAATWPLTALTFGEIAVAGPLTNLVAVPVAELVVLPAALFGAILAWIAPPLGGPAIDLSVVCAGLVDQLAGAVAALSPPLALPSPSRFELGCWLVGLAAAIAWRRGWLPWRRAVAALALAALSITASFWLSTRVAPALRDELRVTFLDVGQGDAAVLELPGGDTWLVDAGGLGYVPDRVAAADRAAYGALPGARALLPYLDHRRIRRLDVVVISHPHPDHYRGLAALAGAIDIGEVWVAAGAVAADAELAGLLSELRRRGSRVNHPDLDGPYRRSGVSVTALAPRYGGAVAVDPVVSVNDNSLVVRVAFAGRSLLFTGDLELEGEELLLAAQPTLTADVVKVPHHGSRTSSGPALVDRLGAGAAIVSCGSGNRFGFPDAAVVRRWRAAGAAVYRTDRHGAVTVRIGTGGSLSVEPFDAPAPADP